MFGECCLVYVMVRRGGTNVLAYLWVGSRLSSGMKPVLVSFIFPDRACCIDFYTYYPLLVLW